MQTRFVLALLIIVLILMFIGCLDVQMHSRAAGKEVKVGKVVQAIHTGAVAATSGNAHRSGNRLVGVDVISAPGAG